MDSSHWDYCFSCNCSSRLPTICTHIIGTGLLYLSKGLRLLPCIDPPSASNNKFINADLPICPVCLVGILKLYF